MPKIRNKITGEIVEIPDQGGLQRVGPANPMRPLQVQGAQLGNQRTAQQINIDNTMLPLQVKKAEADAAKAQAEARLAGGLTAAQKAEISGDQTTLENLADLVKQQQALYRKNFKGINLGEMVPNIFGLQNAVPSNQEYNSLGLQMRPLIAKALGFASKQMDTPAELKNLDSYIPQSTDYDNTAEMKFQRLQGLLQKQMANKSRLLGVKRQKQKSTSKVIDFNDLPE